MDSAKFETEITQEMQGCLVYFTVLEKDIDIVKEYPHYNKFVRALNGPVKLATFRMDASDKDEFQKLKK